jgi:hypothetical protein
MILRGLGYLSWAAHFAIFAFFLRAARATGMADREMLGPIILASFPFIAIATLVMIVHIHMTSDLSPADLRAWRKRLWFMGTLTAAWYLSCKDRRIGAERESRRHV